MHGSEASKIPGLMPLALWLATSTIHSIHSGSVSKFLIGSWMIRGDSNVTVGSKTFMSFKRKRFSGAARTTSSSRQLDLLRREPFSISRVPEQASVVVPFNCDEAGFHLA
ncbi:unnamed protein product [Somion occarium]|uniref:Secreted protein n=1 Tax=Somion occarium TaxID=3059160 RepID=A0ABP1D1Q0_9APHY